MKQGTRAIVTTVCLMAGMVALAGDVHVVQTMKFGEMNMESETWLSGKKLRTSVKNGPAGQVDMIIDTEAGKIITLMAGSKQYMEMPLEQVMKMAEAQQSSMPEGDYDVKKTGKTQEIGGWKCEEYTISHPPEIQMSIWVTKDVDVDTKSYLEFGKEFQQSNPLAKAVDPSQIDGFPIKMEGTFQQQGQAMSMTSVVTALDAKPVDPSMFEIPAGYESMGNMFGQ